MRKVLLKLVDQGQSGSLAKRQRKKRDALFETFISQLRTPISVLDLGGTPDYWRGVSSTE